MLYYNGLYKRGDSIKKLINWCLLNNGKKIIDTKKCECEYNKKELIYNEKDASNKIDLNNKIYLRENKDYLFKVDFKNNKFLYKLKEKNIEVEDKLKDSSIEIGKKITLNYSLDDKEKTIIIDLL